MKLFHSKKDKIFFGIFSINFYGAFIRFSNFYHWPKVWRVLEKGDPLVSPDFFENAMAHPRMKIQVLVSP